MQSILLMVFFLSIGLMLDLRALAPKLPAVILIAVAVLLAKTAVNAVALRLLRAPPREALLAAIAMAPLGEFGFVLAAAGLAAGAITSEGYQIALAVIAVSLAASPLWMLAARRAGLHRETEASTVRGFFGEIFADEMAAARRHTARALSSAGVAAKRSAEWTQKTAGDARNAARDAARRALPKPANDRSTLDDENAADTELGSPVGPEPGAPDRSARL